MTLAATVLITAGALLLGGCGSQSATEATSSAASTIVEQIPASTDTGSASSSSESAQAASPKNEDSAADTREGSRNLVIYFDYAENINTDGLDVDAITSASLRGGSDGTNVENLKKMADEAAAKENADEFSIQVNEVYDADFEAMTGVARQDQADNKQFTFKNELTNLDDYDTIFLGSPVWWGALPQPVVVFLDQYDFSGKTIVPFGIHHGSRFGRMLEQYREAEPDATVLDGFTIDADTSNDEVLEEFDEYLDSLQL